MCDLLTQNWIQAAAAFAPRRGFAVATRGALILHDTTPLQTARNVFGR